MTDLSALLARLEAAAEIFHKIADEKSRYLSAPIGGGGYVRDRQADVSPGRSRVSGKLTWREHRVLRQLRAHWRTNRCFWWSPKTCASLAALGLAEQYTPPSVTEHPRLKARPYRITEAGPRALSQESR